MVGGVGGHPHVWEGFGGHQHTLVCLGGGGTGLLDTLIPRMWGYSIRGSSEVCAGELFPRRLGPQGEVLGDGGAVGDVGPRRPGAASTPRRRSG